MSTRVKLSDLLIAIESSSDLAESSSYVDRQTGKVVHVSEEVLQAIEDDAVDDLPDWEKAEIETVRAVLDDEGADPPRFVEVPDQFDVDEYRMMERFIGRIDDTALADRLERAIHGRGAFRRFKDTLADAGRLDEWFAFRDADYREFATDWCKANGLEIDPDH